jgi:hypothetical protein
MKLVENTDQLWKHYSTQCLAVVGLMQGIWAATPQAWIDTAPSWLTGTVAGTSAVLAALGLIGKMVKQDLDPK